MVDVTPQRAGRTLDTRLVMSEFGAIAGLLAIGLFCVSLFLLATPWWAMGAYAVIGLVVARGLLTRYPHSVFGLCNSVTLLRAAILAFLVGVLFEPAEVSTWAIFGAALFALLLDGADGFLARRSGLHSEFGARFDMETDAALGAVLAVYLLITGVVGAQILVLGFARYVFVLAGIVWPSLRADLPVSFRRKAICVVQIGTLIAMIFPLFPEVFLAPVSIVAALLLIYSFAVDTVWLMRRGA